MSGSLTEQLRDWLDQGRTRIGEVAILRRDNGWRLRHHADRDAEALAVSADPHEAIIIARLDAAGAWRPLRGAPSLRRGWALDLPDLGSVRLALEFLYPAAVGNFASFLSGELSPTPLREVLERQTGMYRVTRHLTDAQAGTLVPDACRSSDRCLKTILWPLRPGEPVPGLPPDKMDPDVDQSCGTGGFIPLLCTEACPLLIGAARETVKSASP
jgi:sirohydrochlorin cobaltochelatase